MPATTAYVTVGAYGWQPGAWPLWAALAGLVVLTAGGLVIERRRRGHHEPETSESTADDPTPAGR